MRLSSVRCYRQIKEEGLLSRARLAAYEALIEHGPATAGELSFAMSQMVTFRMARNDLAGRLKELKELGVVMELPTMRGCQVTGRLCLVWEVVDALPNNDGLTKRVPAKQQVKELESTVAMLRARVEGLELENAQLRQKGQLSLGI